MEETKNSKNKPAHGGYYRRSKNIMKQYGKNMKAHEEVILEMREPEYLVNLLEKHGMNIMNVSRAPSIIHTRWGFASKGDANRINEVDDITDYIVKFEEDKNASIN